MSEKMYDEHTGEFMDYQEYLTTYGEYRTKKYFKPIAFKKALPDKATSAEVDDTDALIAAGKKIMEQKYSAPKSNIKKQHIRLGLGFLKLPQNQNKTMLNIFLRNSTWKSHHPKDKYKLHYHYFIKQRKLAACWALETLADLFGVSEKTIRRWRDELVAEGSMTVVKRYHKPDIYIMGEVDEDGNEKYYADKMDKYVH